MADQVNNLIADSVFTDLDRLIKGLTMAQQKADAFLVTMGKLRGVMHELDTFLDTHADTHTDKATV